MGDLPALAIAVPLVVAAGLLAISPKSPRVLADIIMAATVAAVVAMCAVLLWASAQNTVVYWVGGWIPRHHIAVGIPLVIDPTAAAMALLAAVMVLASAIFSWRYFDVAGELYHVLMLCFLAGMVGFAFAGDIFTLFVFFELMSIPAFVLTATKIEEVEALSGGFNFAVINTAGGLVMLLGIALIYARTGTLSMGHLGAALAGTRADGMVVVAFVFISVGLFTKAGLVPFHFWLADAHAVAPTPVCVVLSGVMVELGAFAVARVDFAVFGSQLADHTTAYRVALVGAGAFAAVLGGLMSLGQRHLKRLLAQSTVSHIGVIVTGIGLLEPTAVAGAGIYLIAHALIKGALFMMAGVLLHRFGTVDANELAGRGKRMRWVGVLLAVGGLALAGLPPIGLALGTSLIHEGARHAGAGWLVVVAVFASVTTGAAVLRAGAHVFLGWGGREGAGASTPEHEEPETRGPHRTTPVVMLVPAAVLLAAVVALGLIPGLAEAAYRAALRLMGGMSEAVGAGPASAQVTTAHFGPFKSSPWLGTASAAGAVVVAVSSLGMHRLPRRLQGAVDGAIATAMAPLHRLHSGKIGDQLVWLAVGIATLVLVIAIGVVGC